MTAPLDSRPDDHRVCVWYGKHKIIEHFADQANAARFEAAMHRRFASLRVTNEPMAVPGAGHE